MSPEVETVAVAIARALGLKPSPSIDENVRLTWTSLMIVAQEAIGAARPIVQPEHREEEAAVVAEPNDPTTSEEVASVAARLMHHEDPDVRMVAASAVRQRVSNDG